MNLTHALFLGDVFLGEVLPDELNFYSVERLVPLPTNYWSPGYRWKWIGRIAVEDVAAVEADMLAGVKAEAERRKMLVLTPGGAKKTEYAEKRAEVLDWDTLGGTVSAALLAFAAILPAARNARFAHAIADAAAFGDTAAAAIERFRTGIARSATTPAICAAEARACAMIKAAATAPAKRAAAASTAWPA